eukprot:7382468-Pyramimonas_sp.AAC.1
MGDQIPVSFWSGPGDAARLAALLRRRRRGDRERIKRSKGPSGDGDDPSGDDDDDAFDEDGDGEMGDGVREV